jgi:hypothetical protein
VLRWGYGSLAELGPGSTRITAVRRVCFATLFKKLVTIQRAHLFPGSRQTLPFAAT